MEKVSFYSISSKLYSLYSKFFQALLWRPDPGICYNSECEKKTNIPSEQLDPKLVGFQKIPFRSNKICLCYQKN